MRLGSSSAVSLPAASATWPRPGMFIRKERLIGIKPWQALWPTGFLTLYLWESWAVGPFSS